MAISIKKIITHLFFPLLSLGFFIPVSAMAATLTRPANNLGLVGYWSLNEGTSTTATDFSGNGNTGTLMNMANPPTATSGWGNGKVGKGLNFDGTNDCININNSSSLQSITNAYTLSQWMKSSATLVGAERLQGVYAGGSPRDIDFDFWTTSVMRLFDRDASQSSAFGNISSASVLNGQWHLVTGTRNGTEYKVYVDGVLMTSETGPSATGAVNTRGWRIGCAGSTAASNSSFFNGQLDEVRLYSRALSATEIATLYKSGVGKLRAPNNLNLAAYWSMNEGVSTQAGDFSGNGNTGTLANGPTWTAGKLGQAVNLDGSNDYIDLGSNTSLNVASSQAFSVSGWVKTTENYGPIVSLRSNASQNPIVDIMVGYDGAVFSSGNLMALVRSDTSSSGHARVTGGAVNDGKWHFFTLTRDAGSTITLYLDGVSQGTNSGANSGAAITTTTYRAIGSERYWVAASFGSADERYLVGQVDEVRMYVGKQLSATEIATLYKSGLQKINSSQNTKGPTSGLVGMWSFNGGDVDWSKNKAYDRSGQGNDGVFTNMSTATAPTIGKVGQGISFDGSNDYIRIPNNNAYNASYYTVAAWVKTSPSAATQQILTRDDANTRSFQFRVEANGKVNFIFFGNSASDTDNQGATSVNDGNWHHVAGVFNGSTIQIFVDGQQDFSQAFVDTGRSVNLGLTIGIFGDNVSDPFNGKIDEARYYNRALSAAEITQLYLMGK